MHRPRAWILVLVALAVFVASGCDPKLTGLENSTTNTTTDDTSLEVASQAISVGSVIATHMAVISGAFAISADYDTASTADPLRTVFASDCVSFELLDAGLPKYRMRLGNCTDGNGTTYHGELDATPQLDGGDGFLLKPDGFEDYLLSAGNPENVEYQHTYSAGSLDFDFQRDGSGTVTSTAITNFLRHYIGSEVVSFTYTDVTYAGTIGNEGQWPENGSVVRVSWDGVGIFDVTFTGSSHCTYRIMGIDYECDLNDTSVTIVVPS
jgi:hypothetical protein